MIKASSFFLLFLLNGINIFSQLKINEISSKNGFIDEYEENVDWIEITNTGSADENLNSYYLSDNPNSLGKWRFPDMTISPNEKIIICASGREIDYFPEHWESIIVPENIWNYFTGTSQPPNNWNSLTFDDQNWNSGPGGFGYGDGDDNTIIPSNTISIFLRKIFTINQISDITHLLMHADYDDGFIAYLNGVEIMRSNNFNDFFPSFNSTTNMDHEAVLYSGGIPESKFFNKEELDDLLLQGDNILAIQVHNFNNTSSDLSSNFFLSGGISSTNIIYQNLTNWINPPEVNLHCNFKLSNEETIVLSNINGTIIDSVSISADLTHQLSYGRSPDGFGNWCFFNQPSPGITNINSWCYNGITNPPNVITASGWYNSSVNVYVNVDPQTQVRYTTNGDEPSINDPLYINSLTYNTTTTFSTKAFSNGNLLPSKVTDRTFIVDEQNHNLPVFSIITDENNLWDWNTGIYVPGPNAGVDYPHFGSNFWQPWSKWSRLEYFNSNRVKEFEAEFDLEIHGGWSRAEPQKSFRIDTKSIYSGEINYPLIPKKEISSFNNFNLRNGGQHTWSDRIQDGLISRLVKETNTDRMGFQPCIVYLNGSYWGLYGIREKIDEHYVESNFGIKSNKVDLLNRDSALAGSNYHFMESYQMIKNTNFNDTNFLDQFKSRFDIDNYIDYFIIQTYIQNMDWLGIAWGLNNIKLWRPDTTGGKWRYVLYDTDASLGYFGQSIYDNYLSLARNPAVTNEHSEIFNKLLNNSEFKCQFANRYNDLINTTFQTSNFNLLTNEIKGEITNAVQDHVNLWASQGGLGSFAQWSSAINTIIQYNTTRIATARYHLNQSLGLNGENEVTLDVNPANSGRIKISTISPESYPWDGKYHGGCPVDIKAIANSGYIFSHWDENSITSNDPNNNELFGNNINTSFEFTANFTTCDEAFQVSIISNDNTLKADIKGDFNEFEYSWYANDHLISNDSIIYNPNDGIYQIFINNGDCEINSDFLIYEDDHYQFDIYPNPSNGEFELIFVSTIKHDITISLTNALGQLIKKETIPQFVGQYKRKYLMTNFNKGVYFIKIEMMDYLLTKKLVLAN